ncbi:hypothetical protein [Aliarcobacter cryaerophilus]|uniref:hypothetical protein n=1 Tax=Aliarcobacter cryaerophilus TaxID=28198 RepID=UPI003DA2A2FD
MFHRIGYINSTIDSSFGEIAAYQRVSYYAEFIDKTIRENLPVELINDNIKEDDDFLFI